MTLSQSLAELIDRTRMLLVRERVPAVVPVCRCSGRCRCASMVPSLLLRQIERECEFYRSVM